MSELMFGLSSEVWLIILAIISTVVTIIAILLTYIRPPKEEEKKYRKQTENFKETRRYLRKERANLIVKASDFYKKNNPELTTINCSINGTFFDSDLLVKKDWITKVAIPLERVMIAKDNDWNKSIEELDEDFKEDMIARA